MAQCIRNSSKKLPFSCLYNQVWRAIFLFLFQSKNQFAKKIISRSKGGSSLKLGIYGPRTDPSYLISVIAKLHVRFLIQQVFGFLELDIKIQNRKGEQVKWIPSNRWLNDSDFRERIFLNNDTPLQFGYIVVYPVVVAAGIVKIIIQVCTHHRTGIPDSQFHFGALHMLAKITRMKAEMRLHQCGSSSRVRAWRVYRSYTAL